MPIDEEVSAVFAPLYTALRQFADTDPLRLHMPGHKGKPLPCPELAQVSRLDFTELRPTGNLYEAGGPIEEAQALWAEAAGFPFCQFLTGGATQGVHTAMTLCAGEKSNVLIDRGSHRSVFHALALLDLEPVYLTRPWLGEDNITGPICPLDVEAALSCHPEIKTVCITSPTYYGVISDVPSISHIVHRHGGRLIVDGAHGAHLALLGKDVFRGADLVVTSAHKTLPALGQAAVLLGGGFDRDKVRCTAAIYGSSSPSYPVMASLDLARGWMMEEGRAAYWQTADAVNRLRISFPGIQSNVELDITRFTVNSPDGFALAAELEGLGIYPEMKDSGHVVFILTGCDREADLLRLERGLARSAQPLGSSSPLPPPPEPERVCSPRRALFAPSAAIPLEHCEGRVSAGQIAPYPPGIPVVAPGERISKKELSYFMQIGYNNHGVMIML